MGAVWQKATIVSEAPGGRVTVDALGTSWVRFLGAKFILNDGTDYGIIGFGIDVIV